MKKVVAYRRVPNWSTAQALERIAAKETAVGEALKEIARQRAVLNAEQARLQAMQQVLATERAAEEAKRAGRQVRSKSASGWPLRPAADEASEDEGVRAERTATLDIKRKLYRTPRGRCDGRRTPRRDWVAPDADAGRLGRVVSLLDTPGFLHACVLGEAAHRTYPDRIEGMPDAVQGISLAEAYIDHTLSLSAMQALADPDRRDALYGQLTSETDDGSPGQD